MNIVHAKYIEKSEYFMVIENKCTQLRKPKCFSYICTSLFSKLQLGL
jgi:hypothetical protein